MTAKTVSEIVVKRRQRWLDALESGRYEQGNGQLRSSDERHYCCLGVACKVLRLEPSGWTNGYGPHRLSRNLAVPGGYSDDVYDFGDVDDNSAFQGMCAAWNDTAKLTFPQIAKRLRLKKFFGPDLSNVVSEKVCNEEISRVDQNAAIMSAKKQAK